GPYQFRLLDLAAAQPLTPGTPRSDSLAPANSTNLYRFTANAGDQFFFDVVSQSGLSNAQWRLLDPYTNLLFNSFFVDVNTLGLPVTGTYTLLVEGNLISTGTGSYTINVQPMGNVPVNPLPSGSPLTLGGTISDSIAAAGEQDRYRFTLRA